MNSRRTIILIVAVVVGAVAAFGVTAYIRNIEEGVYAGKELDTVWVVVQPIAKGTTADLAIQQQSIAQVELPTEFIPSTAIRDPEVELKGLVAVTELPPNATLVTGNFVAPSVVSTGITDRLSEMGMVTVTFTVDQTKGAGYMIEPGDFVNVMAIYDIADGEEVDENGDVVEAVNVIAGQDRTDMPLHTTDARYAYQKAEVLAIGNRLTIDLGQTEEEAAAAGAGGAQGLVTLAVPPNVAQELVSIGLNNLYLSLVPSDYVPLPLPPVDVDQRVLAGEEADRLTPYYETEIQSGAVDSDDTDSE